VYKYQKVSILLIFCNNTGARICPHGFKGRFVYGGIALAYREVREE